MTDCARASIGGYVRSEIRAGGLTMGVGGVYGGRDIDGDLKGDTYYVRSRFTPQISTVQQTELGTLRTFTEIRISFDDVTKAPILKYAWIDLNGFHVGKDDSAFASFPGYAGPVMFDDIISYSMFDTNLISYTYKMNNGVSAIVSLEQGNGAEYRSYNDSVNLYSSTAIDSYMDRKMLEY